MKSSRLPLITTLLVLAFFYLPIGVLILNSFNSRVSAPPGRDSPSSGMSACSSATTCGRRCSTRCKSRPFASIGAMILGTCAAFALHRHRSRLQTAHELLITMPLVLPEILMGMSLLLLVRFTRHPLSLVTVTIAHITFCVSYVTLVVQSRLQDFDFQIVDAARDLGATGSRHSGRWCCHCSLPASWPAVCWPSPFDR
jgi:spermidine/putrescine transport system permease protein